MSLCLTDINIQFLMTNSVYFNDIRELLMSVTKCYMTLSLVIILSRIGCNMSPLQQLMSLFSVVIFMHICDILMQVYMKASEPK